MIVNQDNALAVQETNLKLQGHTFKINANAQAFKILTDNLYEHKIATIIRELSCNAYDAQVLAGTKDKPFDIHVPSTMEPWFYIRDYGIGLTENEVYDIYTTYFQSTKGSSNDFIGAFGLGSKTPLCYTEQFLVTSYKDDIEYQYNVFFNNNGFPEINLLIKKETNEHNGLKVEFAIKESDTQEFIRELQNFYQFIDYTPNFINSSEDKFTKGKKIGEFDNMAFYESSYYSGRTFAKMGMVLYEVSITNNIACLINHLTSAAQFDWSVISQDKFKLLIRTLTSNRRAYDLVLDFNIGDLDVTASRESLSLNERTLNKFAEVYVKSYYKLFVSLLKEIEAADFKEKIQIIKQNKHLLENLDCFKIVNKQEKYTLTYNSIEFDNDFWKDFDANLAKVTQLKPTYFSRNTRGESNFKACKASYKPTYISNTSPLIIYVGTCANYWLRNLNYADKETDSWIYNFLYIKAKKSEVQKIIDGLKEFIPPFMQVIYLDPIDYAYLKPEKQEKEEEEEDEGYFIRWFHIKDEELQEAYTEKLDDSLESLLKKGPIYYTSFAGKFSKRTKLQYLDLLNYKYKKVTKLFILRKDQIQTLKKLIIDNPKYQAYMLEDMENYLEILQKYANIKHYVYNNLAYIIKDKLINKYEGYIPDTVLQPWKDLAAKIDCKYINREYYVNEIYNRSVKINFKMKNLLNETIEEEEAKIKKSLDCKALFKGLLLEVANIKDNEYKFVNNLKGFNLLKDLSINEAVVEKVLENL